MESGEQLEMKTAEVDEKPKYEGCSNEELNDMNGKVEQDE